MPGCSSVGCSNSTKKGFLMKKFPKDPKRRNEWLIKMKRDNWKPTDYSCLCEVHFAPEMWEKTREDGTRKLRGNAVPTIFFFSTSSKRKSLIKRNKDDNQSMQINATVELPSINKHQRQEKNDENSSSLNEKKITNDDCTLIKEIQFKDEIKEFCCLMTFNNLNDYKEHIKLHDEREEEINLEDHNESIFENKNIEKDPLNSDPPEAKPNPLRQEMIIKLNDSSESFQMTKQKEEKTFKCDICILFFTDSNDYNNHMIIHRNKLENNSEDIYDFSHIKIIQNNELKFKCTICSEIFQEKIDLVNHLSLHSQKKPFICIKCESSFKCLRYLDKHFKRIHNEKHKNKCEECEKSFYSKERLLAHRSLTHNHEKPFKCDECSKTFCSVSGLTNHKSFHSGITLKCKECPKFFATKQGLNNHMNYVHSKKKNLLCQICFKSFLYKNSLEKHWISHTGEKPYKCNECDKSYNQKSALEKHIKTLHKQEKPYQCSICQKSFSFKNVLVRHLSSHSQKKPFSCNECQITFKEEAYLQKHIKYVHHKYKPFKCLECEKCFSTKPYLNIHIITVHRKEKNFLCEVCSKTFGQKSSLMTHKKLHSQS